MSICHRLASIFSVAVLCPFLVLCMGSLIAQETSIDHPVATAPGKVGDLLRRWWDGKTAAGNVGDYYDNRDGGHSDLDTAPWPQLQRLAYSAADLKQRKNWAAQLTLLPRVVFGNSST